MINHKQFVAALKAIADPAAVAGVARFFWPDPNGHSADNKVLGVRIGKIFPIAKKFAHAARGRREAPRESVLRGAYGCG